ncbi:MAG: cell division protein FtsA [candidate division WOR-3 bacterium]
MEGKRIVSVDLGTSKVISVFGSPENGSIKIEGYSPKIDSRGIESGVIQNIEKVSNSLKEAVEQAFRLKGDVPKKRTKIILTINGSYIESEIVKGFVPVKDPDGEIDENDRIRVINTAVQRSNTSEKSIIYVHPNEYTIDDQKGIKEPVGMMGTKLEVETFILKAKKNILDTLRKVAWKSNFEIENFVFSPIASSYAVLEEEEINQGVLLMDIGMGTVDIAVWNKGSLIYADSFPIGGKYIINDLIKILRITSKKAKELLELFSTTYEENDNNMEIEVEGIGERPSKKIKAAFVKETIFARLEEIFERVKWYVEKVIEIEKLPAGIVLVGGIAKLKGITEVAENFFNVPCIVGKPKNFKGLSTDIISDPSYTAALGALKVGYMLRTSGYSSLSRKIKKGFSISQIFRNIKYFFENF